MQGTIRLFGCGGAGINIAGKFNHCLDGSPEPGLAQILPTYIDTSRSNTTGRGYPDSAIALLPELDGSGKVRRENHEAIEKHVRQILQQHTPGDFNVVVFSASGGSGSVFGPLILAELLRRDAAALAIVIGSDESAITAQNTLNTLKSLEAIAERAKKPVVMHYDHNDRDVKRSDVDKGAVELITGLAVLASRQNAEMDSRDLANWVGFHKTTSVRPRLSLVAMYRNNESAEEASEPVSIASLYADADATPLEIVPEYHSAGYPIEKIKNFGDVMHFVITINGVQVIVKKLTERLGDIDRSRGARVDHKSIVDAQDDVTDSGLIL